ncbi:MAG: hypothetical protein AAGE01_02305 [Pseudomonadota bacterium]
MTEQREDRDCKALLPWYVNGTLAPDETARVERWLAARPEARMEAEGLGALRRTLAADTPTPGDAALALMRTKARIAADEGRPGWRLWLPGLAAAMTLAIAVGIASWPGEEPTEPAFETLSDAPAPAAGVVVRLVFRDGVSVAQQDALLEAWGATRIDAPGSGDVLAIRLESAVTLDRIQASSDVRFVGQASED